MVNITTVHECTHGRVRFVFKVRLHKSRREVVMYSNDLICILKNMRKDLYILCMGYKGKVRGVHHGYDDIVFPIHSKLI